MAQHRHKRETTARRLPKAPHLAGSLAVLATASAVTLGVLTSTPVAENLVATGSTSASMSGVAAGNAAERSDIVSRSQSRLTAKREARERARERARKRAERERTATLRAVKNADDRAWTTTELNLWASADKRAENLGVIDAVTKVLVTGRRDNGRTELVVNGKSRWVTAGYLSDEKPETGPSLGGTCSNGSGIDAGRASLYEIHEVVCANWPQITAYGTWRGDGEHGQGRAIDIMTSGETGWAVADFLRANYSALGIEYIIYSQHIWSVERGGEGWRAMSDRGSATANHYDHVHVTVY